MNSNIKYHSTVDTIILTENVYERNYNKARSNQSVNVGPYTCERSGSNYKKALELNIRHKGHKVNFMHIELKELPNRESFYLKIIVHLNHFIHQAFPNESFVSSKKIIEDLESIISRYLRFPGFNLDAMNVSRIDIALDFLVKKDPSHYLNIIKHKEIPRYLLRYNNSSSALSIHSYSCEGAKGSAFKGAIYNKSDNLGIEKNIIRFEFRLEGDQINQLSLDSYNQQGYCDIISEKKDVTKFSDIFYADIGEQLKKRFIDDVILKDNEEYEATESHDNYLINRRDWIDRFADADDYCRKLALLLKERDVINKAIKEVFEDWAIEQIEKDQDQETLHELWTLIEDNLKEKFTYQLCELDVPEDQILSHLEDLYYEMEIFDFLKKLNGIIPPKRKIGVDQADLSTFKVIINYFRKRANEYFSDEKKELKKEVTNRINSLHNDFEIHNKCMFILHYHDSFDGTKGQELYNELKTLANSYSFTPSEKVFNLYKQYTESSGSKRAS